MPYAQDQNTAEGFVITDQDKWTDFKKQEVDFLASEAAASRLLTNPTVQVEAIRGFRH